MGVGEPREHQPAEGVRMGGRLLDAAPHRGDPLAVECQDDAALG